MLATSQHALLINPFSSGNLNDRKLDKRALSSSELLPDKTECQDFSHFSYTTSSLQLLQTCHLSKGIKYIVGQGKMEHITDRHANIGGGGGTLS